jgi:hypothetical protein
MCLYACSMVILDICIYPVVCVHGRRDTRSVHVGITPREEKSRLTTKYYLVRPQTGSFLTGIVSP